MTGKTKRAVSYRSFVLPLAVQPVLSGGSRSTQTADLPENHDKATRFTE